MNYLFQMEEEEFNPYIDDYPFIGRCEYLEKWEKNWENHKIFGIFGMQCVGKSRSVWEFLRQKKSQCEEKRPLQSVHIDLRHVKNLDIIRIRLLAEIVGVSNLYAYIIIGYACIYGHMIIGL